MQKAFTMTAINVSQLTRRENEVLQLVAAGQCNKEIAATLHLSVTTVQNHLQRLYKKLQVRNRTEATQQYWQQGNNPLTIGKFRATDEARKRSAAIGGRRAMQQGNRGHPAP